MSRFSFGLLNISTRYEGFFWTSLHFTRWHYRISSKYPFFQYLWEAVFSADAALSPLSLLASSWFSRSQTKMSVKSSSLSGLWQKTPLSDRLDGPVNGQKSPIIGGQNFEFLKFPSYPREFPAAAKAREVGRPNYRILVERNDVFLKNWQKTGQKGQNWPNFGHFGVLSEYGGWPPKF